MARCKVTVAGRSAELQADSLFRAILNYETSVRCNFPRFEGYPLPDRDAEIEVEVKGRVYRATSRAAWRWANAKANGQLR